MLDPTNKSLRAKLYQSTLARYTFRPATPEDVPGIIKLWPEHWAEAHYRDRGMVPDEPRYAAWLMKVITYGAETFLLAVDGEEVVGFFSYGLDHNFSEKPVAVLDKFFVAKAHRRTAVPALLFELAIQDAMDEGACAFHAPITSETLASRGLENMFRHHGFTAIGTVMGRAL